jgi:hypothetical protein
MHPLPQRGEPTETESDDSMKTILRTFEVWGETLSDLQDEALAKASEFYGDAPFEIVKLDVDEKPVGGVLHARAHGAGVSVPTYVVRIPKGTSITFEKPDGTIFATCARDDRVTFFRKLHKTLVLQILEAER